ncbi:hypothetical protein LSAT2_021720 [Lamellibrachia satsuma]|nr:hypothetical protein LSAT2_021720 [Lamellibrachia satsuma]
MDHNTVSRRHSLKLKMERVTARQRRTRSYFRHRIKLADLWTLLTMDKYYNCCWHTSQRQVNNLRGNFKSWIGRHKPDNDVELYVKTN